MNNTMLHMKLNSAVCLTALLAFLPSSAFAGICFLPDCMDDDVMFGDINMDINEDTEFCEKEGYTYYASGECPQYYAKVGQCNRDDHYLKCDAKTWCEQNGYNTTSCSIPQYVDQPCPSYGSLYKQCKTDNDRACKELGYTKTCSSGQKLYQNSGRCAYDSSYGTCCTPSGCPSYTSTSYSSYGTNGTDGCEYTCYYTCNMNCPSGTSTSNPGGCGGSTRNGCGTKTCYYPYESCCTPYSNETGCSCGTYSCSDGCGGTRKCCSTCSSSSGSDNNSGSGNGNSCTDTCSSKGYNSSQPSGQTCSTTTVCGKTCYYNCKTSETSEPSCSRTCSVGTRGITGVSCNGGYGLTVAVGTTECGDTCIECDECANSASKAPACNGSNQHCLQTGKCGICTWCLTCGCTGSTSYGYYSKSGGSNCTKVNDQAGHEQYCGACYFCRY